MNFNFEKEDDLLSLISPPILMTNIHEHPLLYCYPINRNQFGSSWFCNICKSKNNYDKSSFYCTFCDFDLCPKCLGEYQLDQIKFYNSNLNESNNFKNLNQNPNNFNWQVKHKNHIHNLTLTQKLVKDSQWQCDKCSKIYSNNISSYYCSLCDYDLCKDCFEIKPHINPVIPNVTFNPIRAPVIAPIQKMEVISDFQIKSFKILNEKYKNKNLIYSPLSVQILLGLLSNFLSGKSFDEFKNLLLFKDLSVMNNSFFNIFKTLSNISSLNIINAIFCPVEINSINNALISSNYNSIFSKSKETLQQFVKEKTNNKVNNIFDEVILFGMVLVNILYFNVGWKKKFEENLFQGQFYGKKDKKTVKTMSLVDDFKYYKDNRIEMVKVPYNVEGLFALILLPSKELSLDDLIKEIDQEKVNSYISKSISKKIDLTLPKLSLMKKTKVDLIKMLKEMGIKSIFDSLSDFSQSLQNTSNININELYQNNLIEIDEKGNDNNSLLSIGSPLVNPKNMTVNRPFLFIIRNNQLEKGKDIILIIKVEEI